ncbi:Carboxylic ester hydrolase [Venustampulla echinocandica]|uniref:Carboxylic ester hydrolase n=1 Tax=Venustampulla echinocandica TaxID=2656787 RepID=A0A370TKW4_9HELO|nr:Carboxylic ester hydrolase [Venustampulla echinocandica]RDL36163.1 Carboxylic ester hydrolase [Venustampulla echinocandica]
MQLSTVCTALSLPLTWATPQFSSKHGNCTVGQIVKTSSGPIAGHAAAKYPEVSEYLGIPYAQPPVGNLRFAAPVKYAGSSLVNGSAFGSSCPKPPSQNITPSPDLIAASNVTAIGLELFNLIGNPDVVYSEDCLFLNVWSKPQSGERKKAVMVYVHGGAFSGGTSSTPIFNGATLAEREDVIIVTLNYRVSILGFPGNPTAQNNVGFLDQRLAMEWVRDNIANFGGDPARITLFGQSAGGSSVDYYAYAWASDPIVAGIIAQSGTTISFGLPYPESVSAAAWYSVSAAVGCGDSSTDSTALLACMRNVEHDSLLKSVPSDGLNALFSAFGPTVDNTIVFSNYSQQTAASIPMLLGSADYESGVLRTQLALANTTFVDSDWDEANLAGYTCPAGIRANASIAANNPTWRYRYHGVFPNTNISWQGGAYHGAELTLLFGTTFATPSSTPEEIEFETYIQGAWAAFAKDPVHGLTTYEGGWPLYDPAKESLVRLAYDNLVGTNLAFPEIYDAGCVNASLPALLCRIFGLC